MSSVCRVTDMCSGHDGFDSRSAISGSSNVFINSLPAHRLNDMWEEHHDLTSSHDSMLSSGSSTVFVNGLPLGRIGDQIACGSTVMTGSDNVFAG